MINGILNIRKEPGFTSHDVVGKLRGIVHQKKIGHTGTLDPDAVGVLPVCLGKATRLCDMLTDETKTYEAVLLLGRETDTQDTSGEILAEAEVCVSEEQVRECIASFVGEQMQVPPMYSAKKVNGKKLYELAREGIVIERKPVRVVFHAIEILSIELPRITMSVTCSKGTYIRTLCHDIGEALGCHGCMAHLTRTRVGSFSLAESVTLDQVREAVLAEELDKYLVPIDALFASCPVLVAETDEAVKKAVNGNEMAISLLREGREEDRILSCPAQKLSEAEEGAWVRLYLTGGEFVGVFALKKEASVIKPVKMFLERP